MDLMDENRIPEALCAYFNEGDMGIVLVPETWREDCGSLWLTGGGGVEKAYVDETKIIGVPFEIRVRCRGRSVGDRLDVIALFGRISERIRCCPMGEDCRISVSSGASKSAIYDNGEEEYRGAYVLKYRKS